MAHTVLGTVCRGVWTHGLGTCVGGSAYHEHLVRPLKCHLTPWPLLLAVCPREHPTDTLGSAEVRPGILGHESIWVFIFLGNQGS